MKKTHDQLNGADLYYQFNDRGDGTQRLSFHIRETSGWEDVTKQVWRPPFAKEWCEHHDPDGAFPKICGFWGRYRWLSNFYEKPITIGGELLGETRDFPSTEHAYQFAKLPEESQDKWYPIICQYTCGQVKEWGREIQIRSGWESLKETIMKDVVAAKFSQNRDLHDQLLSTKNAKLVETNWWGDIFFGIDPTAPVNGLNTLGRVLMQVRDDLLDRQTST